MTTTLYRWRTPADIASWHVEVEADSLTTLHAPIVGIPSDCTQIVPSWQAFTPPGTAVEIRLRVRYGTYWTAAYRLALWDNAIAGSRRTSFDAQRDDDGAVSTDTLVVRPGADAVEAIVVLHGTANAQAQLGAFTLACSGATPDATEECHRFEACSLETPRFSQFSYAAEDGWCSPTSLAMVLGYWYERTQQPALASFISPESVPNSVAPSVYDPCYGGYGNWSFNVAFAASYGLESYVARMTSLDEIEPWLAAGVPVVLSVAWKEGQLTGAPLPRSRGHLLVATGLTHEGDILVADPAGATVSEVQRRYIRAELEQCWLRPYGTVYLIYPAGWLGEKE